MPSIKEQVAERLAALGPAVQEGVVAVLVEQVKDKRVKAILTVQNLIEEANKDLKKIKPEQTFGPDHKVVSEYFSKASMEARKKIEEKISKMEAALALALGDTPNFDKLFNLASSKGNAPAEAPAEE